MGRLKGLNGVAGMLSVLFAGVSMQPALAQGFDPQDAFCERQTFLLESVEEVLPWLDYVGGLRVARTEAPELDCPSATVRAIYDVFASPSEPAALAKREAFLMLYVSQAMEPDTRQRALDRDGSFRYRNDLTLASFGWLLCPGTGEVQIECLRSILEGLPVAYLETSPVFCDFAEGERTRVEWPQVLDVLPLTCSPSSDAADPSRQWLNAFSVTTW